MRRVTLPSRGSLTLRRDFPRSHLLCGTKPCRPPLHLPETLSWSFHAIRTENSRRVSLIEPRLLAIIASFLSRRTQNARGAFVTLQTLCGSSRRRQKEAWRIHIISIARKHATSQTLWICVMCLNMDLQRPVKPAKRMYLFVVAFYEWLAALASFLSDTLSPTISRCTKPKETRQTHK